ncbi:MAG: hypothetical protein JWP13_739 [Candidatus Saccharibacteria bacterium]|nr:hypothetical protein [Candidatus Saccharibacteria bacterium]
MNIAVQPGKYVVAVSGGVDSMALLHALQALPDLKLTVAHFDHGIRSDSGEDMLLVQKISGEYGLPFVFATGNLGPTASEDVARKARYEFLHKVRKASGATGIITAHHKDDVIETALINLIRGTGRKGLTSLKSIDGIKRPMLHLSKAEVRDYAHQHSLEWRDDSTNADLTYLRNHIRHRILSRFSPEEKARLHRYIQHMHVLDGAIDELLGDYLQRYSFETRLKRHEFIMLPHNVALEVMAAWLRSNGIRGFDKKMLERLVHAAKIHTVGRLIPINNNVNLKISREFLALESTER